MSLKSMFIFSPFSDLSLCILKYNTRLYPIILFCWRYCLPRPSVTQPSSGFRWKRSALIQRNSSRQDGGKLPGVRVVGAVDAPGRLPFNSIIVGFGIFFNPAFGAWGLYRPVSREKGQPISRLPLADRLSI